MRRLALGLAAMFGLAVFAPGVADAQRLSVQVEFDRADLLDPDRVAAINRDIRRAAYAVCPIDDPRSAYLRVRQHQCVVDAATRATERLKAQIEAARSGETASGRFVLVLEPRNGPRPEPRRARPPHRASRSPVRPASANRTAGRRTFPVAPAPPYTSLTAA